MSRGTRRFVDSRELRNVVRNFIIQKQDLFANFLHSFMHLVKSIIIFSSRTSWKDRRVLKVNSSG
jgi:hypothetical protein